MRLKNPIRFGTAGAFIAVSSYLALPTPATVNDTIHSSAQLRGTVTTQACSNNPGPFITLDGELALASIDAVLIFRNNPRGTHEHEEPVTLRVSLAAGQVIQLHKQPPLGGVGGNPYIFLQLFDDQQNPLTEKFYLGRCVQGLLPVNKNFGHFVDIFAQIAASCSNSPGPYITLDGGVTFRGVNARLTFQNNRRPDAPHQAGEWVDLDIQLLSPGSTISFAKQPPLGGVGGNPYIYVRFESNGESSDEVYLGRCVQLSNP